MPLLLVLYFFAAAAEEAGWTGYLLQPLRERWGTLGAGLVIGLVWAAWHLVAHTQAGRSAAWTAGQVLGSVAVRVLMVRLYDSSGGIVPTAVAVHTTINVAESVFPGWTDHAAPALVPGVRFPPAARLPQLPLGDPQHARSPPRLNGAGGTPSLSGSSRYTQYREDPPPCDRLGFRKADPKSRAVAKRRAPDAARPALRAERREGDDRARRPCRSRPRS
ncbi:CPBP family intramembrane glutamic endopeptidase [Streptomyces sp. NPDC026294]|uniref:CPBP family intramembrane glutamic endopeptidase n=1 Tax=Streptomyces sp. NPDC026294 TaxID=3155362 RepID=UPI0033FDC64E